DATLVRASTASQGGRQETSRTRLSTAGAEREGPWNDVPPPGPDSSGVLATPSAKRIITCGRLEAATQLRFRRPRSASFYAFPSSGSSQARTATPSALPVPPLAPPVTSLFARHGSGSHLTSMAKSTAQASLL